MRVAARRDAIVDIVESRKRVTVEDLAAQLDASRETIRRDLTALDAEGRLQKYHGGARVRTSPDRQDEAEGRFKTRLSENREAKRAIARAAAKLFHDGDTLFIDTGSTTVIFAEELARLKDLTVITNSTAVAAVLGKAQRRHRVYLIGGEFAADASETVGALAIEQIKLFNAQHVVLTVGAIQPSGILDFDIQEADIARAMIGRAQVVTVLADGSKFGKAGVFQVAPLSALARIVTECSPPDAFATALAGAGVEVVAAGAAGA